MAETLLDVAKDLIADLRPLRFGAPVVRVYNPLEYAWEPYRQYAEKFGKGQKETLLFGMNPGPWGMAQTGVPFGDVAMVRDWIGIECAVNRPAKEHAKRPIEGFACKRSEVSGTRVWGWARDTFGAADEFFTRFFVANYCPLVFMEETGRNRTPDKLAPAERAAITKACDKALRGTVEILQPRYVVGVGHYAEARAMEALAGTHVKIGRILHPSPASPLANKGWGEQATQGLRELGIRVP